MNNRNSLLQPTLGGVGAAQASIFSTTVGYVSSFFGGPMASVIVALVNSSRLRRLQKDWPLVVLALVAETVFLYWQLHGGWPWLDEVLGSGSQRLLQRLLGLGFFGLVYFTHRTYYRNMRVMGIASPSGWLLGILAIAAGIATNVGLGLWMSP